MALTLVALGLVFAAPAQAHIDRLPAMPLSAQARMAEADTPPTPAQDRHARAIALAYWGGPPSCGEPSVTLVALNPAYAGQAVYAECRIEIQSRWDWAADPVGYCNVIVHENGHLVLGSEYFAATNPADPAHAPRGYTAFGMGIMDPSNQRTTACDAMVAPPAAKGAGTGGQGPNRSVLKLKYSKKQKAKNGISFSATCTVNCTATFSANASVSGAGKSYKLTKVTKSLRAGRAMTIKLKLSGATSKAVLQALAKHKKVTATVLVTVRGSSASSQRITVTLTK
jgi:hypothetical protein